MKSTDMPKILTRKLLNTLIFLEGYDGLPINQISYLTGITRVKLIPILSELVKNNYVRIERYGAHTYYCINKKVTEPCNNINIYEAYETLRKLPSLKTDKRLKLARTCYGHLAGKLGVGFINHILSENLIEKNGYEY